MTTSPDMVNAPPGALSEHALREIKPQSRSAFLRAFVKSPKQLGTCFNSGPVLARAMMRQLPLNTARVVLELGSGSGPLTSAVLSRLQPGCRFFAVEMNRTLVESLRRRFPGVAIVDADATKLEELCRAHHIAPGEVDAICASLPYMNFPAQLQAFALDQIHAVLRPGGRMVMLTYWPEELHARARRWRRLLDERFRVVRRAAIVWANVPPAFVYAVEK